VAINWSLEWLGVHTGWIFGRYQYHAALQPQICGIPLAIGFSLLTLLLSAAALERRFASRLQSDDVMRRSLIVAILLLVFDIVLEPGAIKLGYWHWQDGIIPWGNYLSWFGIGWALAYITMRLEVWRRGFPQIAPHFYVAQIIYFGLVYLA
jgi:bisanhydrobacterioruberin hydratase